MHHLPVLQLLDANEQANAVLVVEQAGWQPGSLALLLAATAASGAGASDIAATG